MTQAFNLSQLANLVNTSGQLDATTGLSGAVPIANGGTGQTTAANAINALLPSQSGNSGKFLTSNGSAASWGSVTSSILGAQIVTSSSTQNAAGNNSANDWYGFPGLGTIAYAASSANNVIECRWWMPVIGNATNDSMTTALYIDGSRQDNTRNFSGSGNNQRSSFSYWSYIYKPGNTSSHNYNIYWSPSTSGSNVTAGLFGGEGATYTLTSRSYLLVIEWNGSVLTGL